VLRGILFSRVPQGEAELWERKIKRHTYVSIEVQRQMETLRYDSHPMGMLLAYAGPDHPARSTSCHETDASRCAHPINVLLHDRTIASLSAVHPDANPSILGQNLYRSQGVRNKQIYRLLGKVPTIAAAIYRHRAGRYGKRNEPACFRRRRLLIRAAAPLHAACARHRPYNPPQSHLSYTANFLYMLDRLAEVDYRPHPALVRALDRMFIVHAEHASAMSTVALRHLASTGVDPYMAVSGAFAAHRRLAQRCGRR